MKYRPTTINYQLMIDPQSRHQTFNLNITLGLDGISLPFVLLVGFIMPIVYLSN
jgi:NADH:ubiquinone oxidoreductase subunit 4 (subunit M)